MSVKNHRQATSHSLTVLIPFPGFFFPPPLSQVRAPPFQRYGGTPKASHRGQHPPATDSGTPGHSARTDRAGARSSPCHRRPTRSATRCLGTSNQAAPENDPS